MGRHKNTEIFEYCGLKNTYAKVLAYLIENPETTSRKIEKEMDLRQPQVSIALSDFYKRKWIKRTRIDHDKGKGRPIYIYKVLDRKKIINSLKEKIKKRMDKNKKIIGELQKILEEI